MEKYKFNYVVAILRKYRDMDKMIEERRLELGKRKQAVDENIGGGRAQNKNNNSTFDLVQRLVDDPELHALEHNRRVITQALRNTEEITRSIIQYMYINKYTRYDYTATADVLHISERTLVRKRAFFFEQLYPMLEVM